MASTSASRSSGVTGRFKTAATTLYSDNQSLLVDIRKLVNLMKEVGVDMERHNQSEMVKELENAVFQLMDTYEKGSNFSSALQSIGNTYQPGEELTDFKKLLEDEVVKVKANSFNGSLNNPMIRQFREAIWNVHHAGQPMPGEELEDVVMTSTQCTLLNVTCPVSGKPVTELKEPVRSMDCKHIYDKSAIMHHIKLKNGQCPVAGCPKRLSPEKLVCDPLLLSEIEEMRTLNQQTARTDVIEDFTMLDELDENE